MPQLKGLKLAERYVTLKVEPPILGRGPLVREPVLRALNRESEKRSTLDEKVMQLTPDLTGGVGTPVMNFGSLMKWKSETSLEKPTEKKAGGLERKIDVVLEKIEELPGPIGVPIKLALLVPVIAVGIPVVVTMAVYVGGFSLGLKILEKLLPQKNPLTEESLPLMRDQRWSYPDFPTHNFESREDFPYYFEMARRHRISPELFFARALRNAGHKEVKRFIDHLFADEPGPLEAKKLRFIRRGKIRGGIPLLTDLLKSGRLEEKEYLWVIHALVELNAEEAISHLTRVAKGEGHLLGLASMSEVRFEAAKAVAKLRPDRASLALVSAFRGPLSEVDGLAFDPKDADGLRGPWRAFLGSIMKKRFNISLEEILLAEAEIRAELGEDKDQILPSIDFLIKERPLDPRVLKLLERLEAREKLIQIYQRVKNERVPYPQFLSLMEILVGLGEKEAVQATLDAWLQLIQRPVDPMYHKLWIEDALILAKTGYRTEAVARLRWSLSQPEPAVGEAKLQLAQALFQVGMREEAARLARELMAAPTMWDLEAAELMDRVQPGWDEFIPRIGPPALEPYR